MWDRATWMHWLPGLQTLSRYEARWLGQDFVAGLVLATMLVPVGIAYAVASGVPGIYGLYATIIPLLAYALFGPEPHPRSRTGFVPGGDHPGCCPAVVGRRPDARRRARKHDGDRLRHHVHRCGARAPRLRHRTPLETNPLRLHERNCADRPDQPVAEALRGHDRKRWTSAKHACRRARDSRREGQLAGISHRSRRLGSDPLAQGQSALAGCPHRRRGGDRRRRCVGSCHPRGRIRAGFDSAGPARLRGSVDLVLRYRPDSRWRRRRRPRLLRRYERVVSRLRRADRCARRPQPGDGRAWRGKSCGRLLPGLPDQQQLVANPGCRGRGCEDPIDRSRRGAGSCAPSFDRAGSPPALADDRAGGSRDRFGDRPVRSHRPRTHLSHSAMGILAVDRLLLSAWPSSARSPESVSQS